MKTLIFLIVMMLSITSYSQTLKPIKAATPATKDTTISGQKVTIYTGARGGRYILVESKKGIVYKKYLSRS